MTPATPPSSREQQSEPRPQRTNFQEELVERKRILMETPKKSSQLDAPVTPSTARQIDKRVPLLGPPPAEDGDKSPFKGFHSPEYTPHRYSTGKRRPLQFEQPKGLQRISRVLFPKVDDVKHNDDVQIQASLLPSAAGSSTARRRPSTDIRSDCNDEYWSAQFKHSKQDPGTPSHKVVTYEMAEKWHNSEAQGDENEDYSDILITESTSSNPFLSTEVADEKTREQRRKVLLEENPDIEDVITYLDKKGNVVKKVHLSEHEKKVSMPRRLFDEQLKELESKEDR
ncbi:hypothetical protein HG535_0D06120 [Zygotorulaspora mrakii]|uniref:Uncharacterized protein n=1 Tax=Zygotorulaspora mrakii TaxID=42260 RepID=A0A7H9B337_ZYGMR|nr:uncharacterized protein HG535_0D06120 [Zygotorulaspora mrakii]QLG72903.1 hypothetical protein HG535_0D06120 [Zygotorulaspora mrakii]